MDDTPNSGKVGNPITEEQHPHYHQWRSSISTYSQPSPGQPLPRELVQRVAEHLGDEICNVRVPNKAEMARRFQHGDLRLELRVALAVVLGFRTSPPHRTIANQ